MKMNKLNEIELCLAALQRVSELDSLKLEKYDSSNFECFILPCIEKIKQLITELKVETVHE